MNEKLGRGIPLTMENIKNKKTSGYVIYFPLYIYCRVWRQNTRQLNMYRYNPLRLNG